MRGDLGELGFLSKLSDDVYYTFARSEDSRRQELGDNLEIFGGANNVFAEDPPIVAGSGGCGNTFPATYDDAGVTFFLGVTAKTF